MGWLEGILNEVQELRSAVMSKKTGILTLLNKKKKL